MKVAKDSLCNDYQQIENASGQVEHTKDAPSSSPPSPVEKSHLDAPELPVGYNTTDISSENLILEVPSVSDVVINEEQSFDIVEPSLINYVQVCTHVDELFEISPIGDDPALIKEVFRLMATYPGSVANFSDDLSTSDVFKFMVIELGIDEHAFEDRDFLLECIRINPRCIAFVTQDMVTRDFVLTVLDCNPDIVKHVDLTNEAFIPFYDEALSILDGDSLLWIAGHYTENELLCSSIVNKLSPDTEKLAALCTYSPEMIAFIPSDYPDFQQLIITAIEHCSSLEQLTVLSDIFGEDQELALLAMQTGYTIGGYIGLANALMNWHINPAFLSEKHFVLEATKIGRDALWFAFHIPIVDEEILLEAIALSYEIIDDIDESLRYSLDFLCKAVSVNPLCLYQVVYSGVAYQDDWMQVVMDNQLGVDALSENWKTQRSVMVELVPRDIYTYVHASDELKNDYAFTLFAAMHHNEFFEGNTPAWVWNDEAIMQEITSYAPTAFVHAGEQVRRNEEIALQAILLETDITVLQEIWDTIDPVLQEDPAFQRKALDANYRVLTFIPNPFSLDEMKQHVAIFGENLKFAPPELFDDVHAVRAAIKSSGMAYEFLPDELKHDYALAELAITLYPGAYAWLPESLQADPHLKSIMLQGQPTRDVYALDGFSHFLSDLDAVKELFRVNAQIIDSIDIELLQHSQSLYEIACLYPPILDYLPAEALSKEYIMNQYPDLRQSYNAYKTRLQDANIEYPLRMPNLALLDTVLESRETASFNGEKPDLVMIYPKHDYNNAFETDNMRELQRLFNVHYYETESDEDFIDILLQLPEQAVDTLIIGGHGSQQFITFGAGDNIDNYEAFELDFTDAMQLQAHDIQNCLAPDAPVYLSSCSTGVGGTASRNVVNFLAETFFDHTVTGPMVSIFSFNFTDPDTGAVDFKYTEGYGVAYSATYSSVEK